MLCFFSSKINKHNFNVVKLLVPRSSHRYSMQLSIAIYTKLYAKAINGSTNQSTN